MTLVLSMNPFLDPEGAPPPSTCRQPRDSECRPTPQGPPHSSEELPQDTPCRCTSSDASGVTFLKRRLLDTDESAFTLRTDPQSVTPAQEEHAHVLQLSLMKMRFIDDPETSLRRSVLINNLLRRLWAEKDGRKDGGRCEVAAVDHL